MNKNCIKKSGVLFVFHDEFQANSDQQATKDVNMMVFLWNSTSNTDPA